MNPITLSSDYELIAGERRLEAAKAIGWETINAIVLGKDTDELTRLEMELEENNQRKEFTEEELLEGYHRLERLRNPSAGHRFLRWLKHIFKKIAALFGKKKQKKQKKSKPSAPSARSAQNESVEQSAERLESPAKK